MCRLYFCSQEIVSRHVAGHRSIDYSRNSCRMCYFRHAQLFEITDVANIKNTLPQHSCQNAEVVEAFCDPGCRLSNQCRPSIHQPPVEMPTAVSSVPRSLDMPVTSRRAYHRARRRHAILIALVALPGAQLPATSCLGAFWTPVR